MKRFRLAILATLLLALAGAVQARDGIDEITMQVMEDIVKEDKRSGVRYLELPRPAAHKKVETQGGERGQKKPQPTDKENKKDQKNERYNSEKQRKDDGDSKERRDEKREPRMDDRSGVEEYRHKRDADGHKSDND